ncbi:wd40 repeat-like protein [Fusarium flagelliforme]|uniref:Wd40 repeat-like protein n=1 Tax=Fusarium flagelliforme TaxID=2675880 RepID=A0A395MRP7_9HYPO|nr:wd40 repeat-like protein [Fusarium flagelliforme]
MDQLQLPDLVRDTELRTRFEYPHTIHEFLEAPHSLAPVRQEVWKRIKTIGRGGFSYVCLEECAEGRAEYTPQTRAVKVISSKHGADILSDSRELEAVAKFSQNKFMTNFVKSFGWYRTSEELFISLEYFPLKDLQSYTNEVNILIKACPPSPWWIKLGDFGLSKRVSTAQMPSVAGGTPGFIAPDILEILQYRESDKRTAPLSISHDLWVAADMWSLGEVLVRIASGKATFRSHEHLMGFYLGTRPFPISQWADLGMNQDMIGFIQQAMAAKAINRITSHAGLSHPWVKASVDLRSTSLASNVQPALESLSSLSVSDGDYRSWTTTELITNKKSMMVNSASKVAGPPQNITGQAPVKRKPISRQRIIADGSLSNAAPKALVKPSVVGVEAELSHTNNVSTQVPALLASENRVSFMDEPPRLETTSINGSASVTEVETDGQDSQLEKILLQDGRVQLQSNPSKTVKTFDNRVHCVKFLSDSKRLFAVSAKDIECFDEFHQPVKTEQLDNSRSIISFAISPDSRYAALATDHGELEVADLRTGVAFSIISNLQSEPCDIVFSPNTELIACALKDKSLVLVKRSTGKVIKKLKSFMSGHKGAVTWASFTRGADIVSICEGGFLCVWEKERDYKLRERVSVGKTCVHASTKDSDIIAFGAGEHVRIWHTQPRVTNKFLHNITYGDGVVGGLDFLPCGSRLLVSRQDGKLELWRLGEPPHLIVILSGQNWTHTRTLCVTSLAPNKSHLAIGNLDGTVRILDIRNAIRVDTIRMHASHAVFRSISGDGTKAASICPKSRASAMHILQVKGNSVQDATFSPDSQKLAAISTDGTITIWNVASGKSISLIGRPFHSDFELACATVSSDFCFAATVEYNQIHWGIHIWNIEDGTTRCFLGWYEIDKRSYADTRDRLRFAPTALRFLDDTTKVIGGNEHGIYVCDILKGSMQYYSSHTSRQAHQDPMGKLIRKSTAKELREILSPLLSKDEEKTIVEEPYSWTDDLVISPDSKTAAYLSANGKAHLYDLEVRQEPTVFQGWYGSGRAAISPDWHFLATTSHENKVLLWNISSKDIIEILQTTESPARAVLFSSNARVLFILSETELLVYDTGSPEPPRIIQGFPSYVRSLLVSPELGRVIVASASDGVQVWDYHNGSIIETLHGYDGIWRKLALRRRWKQIGEAES